MVYMGHVEKGVIVLDEPAILPDGAAVKVELAEEQPSAKIGGKGARQAETTRFPLRGQVYRYDAPLAPAVSEQEWAAKS